MPHKLRKANSIVFQRKANPMNFWRAIPLSLALAASGCSDPKAANQGVFKNAAQAYLDTVYPKCYVNTQFPVTVDWNISGIQEKLRALAKAGLVVESEGQVELPEMHGKKRTTSAPRFDLTEEGKKFYKADVTQTLAGKSIGGFCFGKATVKEVSQFSEPADMFGQRISRVNYTYAVSDIPAWAKTPELLAGIKELKADVDSEAAPVKVLNTFVLTNNGWVHEKLFKK